MLRQLGATRFGGAASEALRRLNARHPWSHNAHFHSWITANLPVQRRRALDVGCGEGELAALLGDHFDHVLATDRDARMRAAAAARCAGLPHVVVRDTELSEVRGSFDLVTMVAVLHHLDPEPALRDVRRLLAPGGRFLAVGLAPPRSAVDHVWDAASTLTKPVIGVVKHPWPSPDGDARPTCPVADPTLPFDEGLRAGGCRCRCGCAAGPRPRRCRGRGRARRQAGHQAGRGARGDVLRVTAARFAKHALPLWAWHRPRKGWAVHVGLNGRRLQTRPEGPGSGSTRRDPAPRATDPVTYRLGGEGSRCSTASRARGRPRHARGPGLGAVGSGPALRHRDGHRAPPRGSWLGVGVRRRYVANVLAEGEVLRSIVGRVPSYTTLLDSTRCSMHAMRHRLGFRHTIAWTAPHR